MKWFVFIVYAHEHTQAPRGPFTPGEGLHRNPALVTLLTGVAWLPRRVHLNMKLDWQVSVQTVSVCEN